MKALIRASALSVALIGALAAAHDPAGDALHFDLRESVPEAGASVEAPAEIRLWFTEEPQEGSIAIRLVEAADVHVMDPVQDPEDPMAFFIEIHGTLAPATYTVSWRGIGSDSHVVRDTFEFTVFAR